MSDVGRVRKIDGAAGLSVDDDWTRLVVHPLGATEILKDTERC